MKTIDDGVRRSVRFCITLYQCVFSWDHRWRYLLGGKRICRWYPSCSDYALSAFDRHHTITAMQLTIARIARCHPWNPGGVDEVSSV